MKRYRTLLLVVAGLGSVAVLGIGLWLVLRPRPPKLEEVGGTILVYEVDVDAESAPHYSPEDMAEAMQRRIDPKGIKGMRVRSAGHHRVEISIPRGPQHADDVQQVKDLLVQSGVLEFRILANGQDDQEAIAAVQKYFDGMNDPTMPAEDRAKRKQELETLAEAGKPPPVPAGPHDLTPGQTGFYEGAKGRSSYSWLELSKAERKGLEVDNASEKKANSRWHKAAAARQQGKALLLPDSGEILLHSRACLNGRLLTDERQSKKFDYFVLMRDPVPGKEVTGQYLSSVTAGVDQNSKPCVNFTFNEKGGNLFYEITSSNLPSGSEASRFYRHLAIILDGQIVSAPRLMSAIRSSGQITGNFSQKEVDNVVNILRAGALPASLKPVPISETTVEPQR
jgi:preprotein translocase subunit SecD